jgi:phage head maturation protease
MSFGFIVKSDAWPQPNIREILDVDLLDVSIARYPAYPQTEGGVRSAQSTTHCVFQGMC